MSLSGTSIAVSNRRQRCRPVRQSSANTTLASCSRWGQSLATRTAISESRKGAPNSVWPDLSLSRAADLFRVYQVDALEAAFGPCGLLFSRTLMTVLVISALLILSFYDSSQQTVTSTDCSTLKYAKRTSAWLCGEALICTGDICGRPSMLDFDDGFDVVLRDKRGKELDSKRLSYEQRKFCFEGYSDGEYQLAFVLYKKGVRQPARIFPTKYKHDIRKENNKVYMVEATCPGNPR